MVGRGSGLLLGSGSVQITGAPPVDVLDRLTSAASTPFSAVAAVDADQTFAGAYSRAVNPRPLFSILMPTLDRAELIDRAINSVMAQSEREWELLVADDGSIDGTWPLLCEWRQRESRVRCWHHPNRGQSASRNRLLQHARGAGWPSSAMTNWVRGISSVTGWQSARSRIPMSAYRRCRWSAVHWSLAASVSAS